MNQKFEGTIISIQPRIKLLRSFDQRYHNYLGFTLTISGQVNEELKTFFVGIGKATQLKWNFSVGDEIKGQGVVVENKKLGIDLYKISKLQILKKTNATESKTPPFHGSIPSLEEYKKRGHRRLSKIVYDKKCVSCKWACKMAVEIIIDQWNPNNKKYRFETFCYGPKSCSFYKPGPKRIVPGRKGMSYVEEDWVDIEYTAHRNEDE